MVNKKSSRNRKARSRKTPKNQGETGRSVDRACSTRAAGSGRESAAQRRRRQRLDRTFAALSDPTRRAILQQLAEEDGLPAGRLAEGFRMSWPAVSKHLRVLEHAGLLRQEKDGRVRRCHLEPEPLKEASEWVAFYRRFWTQQLDALAGFFESQVAPADVKPKAKMEGGA